MAAICPCCGYNLARDEPVSDGLLTVDPRGTATIGGQALPLTPAENIILHTLVAADGRVVGCDALINRIGSDAEDGINIISVYVHRLRRKLAAAGWPPKIVAFRGRGYSWSMT